MGIRGLSAVAALVAISAAVAGCGGGSDSLSKAEFIKQADAICKKTDRVQLTAMLKVPNPGNSNSKAHQEKLIVDGALPPVQKEAKEIAELSAPAGGEDEVTTIVKGIEEAVARAEKNPVNGLEAAFVPVEKRAAAYGFKACSEPL